MTSAYHETSKGALWQLIQPENTDLGILYLKSLRTKVAYYTFNTAK